jgi:L-ascorbate metabolism protein UlaG (beta-lactamase superfamily)
MEVFITHISTACVLLEVGSVRILTDPVFDTGERDYSFGAPWVGATRTADPALPAEAIPPLDAILLTHPHHLDNLDDGGRALFLKAREIITTRHGLRSLERRATGLAEWGRTTIYGAAGEQITVGATPAQHGPRWLPGAGHVCGFSLKWEGQQHGELYVSGDTVYFDELRRIPDHYAIGTALLHLGAVHFWRPWPKSWRFTFNSREAVEMAKILGLHTLIPTHYERSAWSHFQEDVGSYQSAFNRAGLQNKVRWLTKGERTNLIV